MKLTYGPREAIRYLSKACSIDLTEAEITTMIAESVLAIEAKGQAVREASKEYEAFVIGLAAEMVARRGTTQAEHEASMDVDQQRN